jgi:hypothetical protein
MECIFCQDSGEEPLQDNTQCNCKYKRHISCWIDYVHSTNIVKCPTCRKDLTTKKSNASTPLRQSRHTPYTPQLDSIPEEHTQTLSYNEFAEEVRLRINIQQPQPQQQQPKFTKTQEKILKIVFGMCFIALVITIVILII